LIESERPPRYSFQGESSLLKKIYRAYSLVNSGNGKESFGEIMWRRMGLYTMELSLHLSEVHCAEQLVVAILGTACPSRALRGRSGFTRWVSLFGTFAQQEQGSVDDPSGSFLDV
jgi:hypothetical protein